MTLVKETKGKRVKKGKVDSKTANAKNESWKGSNDR
jgi:hypothetical protein